MTTYELRSPAGRPVFIFDRLDRAKAFRDDHYRRAKVMLRLFEVRIEAREVAA